MMVKSKAKFAFDKGWEDWNEAEELQNAVAFNSWLDTEIGPKRNFSWGQAWAGYDAKTLGSSIVIRYKE